MVTLICNSPIINFFNKSVKDQVMMMKTRIPFVVLNILMIGIVGCSSTMRIETQTSVPTLAPSSTTLTAVPSPTHTLTLIPTAFPTLSSQELNDVFVRLLEPNAQCLLPCWWGIIPGETTWQVAQQFLSSEKIITDYFVPRKSPTPYYHTGATDPDGVGYTFNFFEEAGIVKMIQVRSESTLNPEAFRQFWASYSPEIIIATYGQPSRVWLESSNTVSEGTPTTMGFRIWFFYDQEGFFVNYGGIVDYKPTYQFCPTFDSHGSDIWMLNIFLISPDNGISLTDLIQYSPAAFLPLDLDQASGMTINELYALYQQKNKPICIETPRDVWK